MANTAYFKKTLTGLDGIRAVLQGLPKELQARMIGNAVGKAAKPIVAAAQSFVPTKTGALRSSITSIVREYPNAATATAVIGPDKSYYRAGAKVAKDGDRRGADRPANYAHLVEFGHRAASKGTLKRAGRSRPKKQGKSVGFVPARPFLRPAVLLYQDAVSTIMAEQLGKDIEKERAALAKTP